ncbi:MAG: hypothetical protein EBZ47_08870 [Chlamydiae bacterium]|nr:hypothetical protein [Chlamydiota bacterium]
MPFAKFPYQKLDEYIDEDKVYQAEGLNYAGGPLYIYGVLGAALGFMVGLSVTIIKIITINIPYESFRSMQLWFVIGKEISLADREPFTDTEDDRRFFSLVFGYIPLGIALSAISFGVTLGTITSLRFIGENARSLLINIKRGCLLAFFEQNDNLKKISQMGKPRTKYAFFLGMPGFILGAGVGAALAVGLTAGRVVINSFVNLAKFIQIGLSHPLRGTRLAIEPYKFKLQFNSLTNFRSSIKLSYTENVLGAPGYLLAPVGYLLGAGMGSVIRVGYETFLSIADTFIALIFHMALRGRKNPQGKNAEDNETFPLREHHHRLIGFLMRI